MIWRNIRNHDLKEHSNHDLKEHSGHNLKEHSDHDLKETFESWFEGTFGSLFWRISDQRTFGSRFDGTSVPDQLNLKAVTWGTQIDWWYHGCSLELCSAIPSMATSGICHRNVNSIVWLYRDGIVSVTLHWSDWAVPLFGQVGQIGPFHCSARLVRLSLSIRLLPDYRLARQRFLALESSYYVPLMGRMWQYFIISSFVTCATENGLECWECSRDI